MTTPEDAQEWRAALYDTGEAGRGCYRHDWRADHAAGVLVCAVCGDTETP